jgi:hypothetical protein
MKEAYHYDTASFLTVDKRPNPSLLDKTQFSYDAKVAPSLDFIRALTLNVY